MPQPLFFNQINYIPPFEIAIHRGIWSFVFLLIVLLLFGKIGNIIEVFKSTKKIFFLSLTAILISINWGGFIFAITINRVQDASMGYFISPMISIMLGYFFLKEKISFLKLVSFSMMIGGLFFLIINIKTVPYLSLIIAISWSMYGLLRKKINVKAEIGLFYESGFIALFGSPYIIYLYLNSTGNFLQNTNITSILLILTGAVTIFPLFFFNLGVKFIPLGLAGVIFFIAPSFHLITSIFILNETISLVKIISFIIVWIGVAIFLYEVFNKDKKTSENNTQLPNLVP